MAIRSAFFRWLLPAAFLLPLWLFIGWVVFRAGGWAFVWLLFIAVPSVFVGQLVLTLLVRARPTVRASRAVSWWDVGAFSLWHVLTIAVGFYSQAWFGVTLTAAIVVFIALVWLMLWQLFREAKGGVRLSSSAGNTAAGSAGYVSSEPDAYGTRSRASSPGEGDVFVITEQSAPVRKPPSVPGE